MDKLKQIKINKIHLTFTHKNKSYILFDIEDSNNTYLYFFNPDNKNRTLLYGKDLESLIQKYLQNPKIECLECQLGLNIKGAICFDEGNLIESNLTIEKANKILRKLKKNVKERKDYIYLFVNENR